MQTKNLAAWGRLMSNNVLSSSAAGTITAGRLFDEGKYIPQKMPMTLIRPVSDAIVGSSISYDHRAQGAANAVRWTQTAIQIIVGLSAVVAIFGKFPS